ncbi:unnamed protein product [Sphagnum troendelagicum]
MQLSDCAGSSQTFPMRRFSIAPEDVNTEIETDDRVHDINTLFKRLHDLQRQVQEKDQTLREQTEMLTEKDETLREEDQTIQMLLAREGSDHSNASCKRRIRLFKCFLQEKEDLKGEDVLSNKPASSIAVVDMYITGYWTVAVRGSCRKWIKIQLIRWWCKISTFYCGPFWMQRNDSREG